MNAQREINKDAAHPRLRIVGRSVAYAHRTLLIYSFLDISIKMNNIYISTYISAYF